MIRSYRAAASCFEPDLTHSIIERRNSLCTHLIELLSEQTLDFVLLPELAIIPDLDKHDGIPAETIDGPTVACITDLAKRFNTNIVIPIIELDGDRMYNTAVFITRDGQIAGRYRKCIPTLTELELGIKPGDLNPDPVIVDGLRIGSAICYDENYPDLIWNWIEKRIDLMIFPSYTHAGRLISAWSLHCGVPLIAAFPWEAVIYNRDGSILAEGGSWTTTIRFGFHPSWIACQLDMQSRIYHLDYNQSKIVEMHKRYGNKLDIRLLVNEARMQISVISDDLSIEQIEHEMELIPLQAYLLETRALADKLRK